MTSALRHVAFGLAAYLCAPGVAPAPGVAAAPVVAPSSTSTTVPAADRLELRNVKWQSLPQEVRQVFVGPDQRLWLVLDDAAAGPRLKPEGAKTLIAAQFAKPTPRLRGVRPVFFEKSGRVWFLIDDGAHVNDERTLLAFDGRTWIEHAGFGYMLSAPGHGRPTAAGAPVQLGDSLFFPDHGGVHRFDGKDWTYQSLSQRDGPAYFNAVVLAPTPDGRRIVALASGSPSILWEYADGKWSKVEGGLISSVIHEFAVTTTGQVIVISGDRLPVAFALAVGIPAKEVFEANLKNLGDDAYEVREKASKAILGLGVNVLPLVKAAADKATDAEVQQRLAIIARALEGEPPGGAGPAGGRKRGAFLAGYYVNNVSAMAVDDRGTAYLCAWMGQAGHDQMITDSLLALAADGDTQLLKYDDFARFRYSDTQPPSFVSVAPAQKAWFGGGESAPILVDLRTFKVLDRVPEEAAKPGEAIKPDAAMKWVHAALPDGTVFLSAAPPDARPAASTPPGSPRHGPIKVYRPGAPGTADPKPE